MPIPLILGAVAKVALGPVIKNAVAKAVTKVADSPYIPEVNKADAAPVATAVIQALGQDPQFINATNSERWYQSGVAWSLNGVTAGALALVMPQVIQHGYHLDRWDWDTAGPSVLVLASAGFGYIRRFVPGLKPLFSRKA